MVPRLIDSQHFPENHPSHFTRHSLTGYHSAIQDSSGSEHWYAVPCPGPRVQALVTTNSLSDQSTTSVLFHDSIWFQLI